MLVHGPLQVQALRAVPPKSALRAILATSVAAVALLAVVIYGHGRAAYTPAWVAWLPALNAMLNAASAGFLVSAYRVRKTDGAAHARGMLAALAASSLFLVSYILYHSLHGDTRFGGHGIVRPLYFFVLISHVTLSVAVLPLVFSSFYFGLSGRIRQHRKVARFTFPVWLYVSVTGVLVFLLLRMYG